MTTRRDATPRKSTTQKQSTRMQPTAARSRQQSSSRSRLHQPNAAQTSTNKAKRRRPANSRHKRARRSTTSNNRIVALIVGVSLAVVLGVVGFFAHRQGLLDWTGLGMRSIPITISAEGFDNHSTAIPLHIIGTRASGKAYERDIYVSAGQESISLPKGTYELTVTASPICEGGSLFSIPTNVFELDTSGSHVKISGTSSELINLSFEHLDIIDATNEQVEAAITAANAAKGTTSADRIELNVAALERLRQQSVLPDDMPESFTLQSTMSGWSTTISLNTDGTFTGSYTQEIPNATGNDYPNGTAYTCNFTGSFNDVERIDETGFRMALGEVTSEQELGEKWVTDGVLHIGAEALGFETGSTFELYRPGTPTENLGYWLSAWCVDYVDTGVPEKLDRWALDNVDASYGFFSEGPHTTTPTQTADESE